LQSGTRHFACEGRLGGVFAPAGLGPGAGALGRPDEDVGQLRIDVDPLATVWVALVVANSIAVLVDDKRSMLNDATAGEDRGVCEDGLAVGGGNLGGLEDGGRGQKKGFGTLVEVSVSLSLLSWVHLYSVDL
jgi:hypothetical protein